MKDQKSLVDEIMDVPAGYLVGVPTIGIIIGVLIYLALS